MSKENCKRGGCVDVFHASLLERARYAGEYDLPVLKEEREIPRKLITFSRALREKHDYHQWVCFYEDDFLFERIWNSPNKYLPILSRFDGIITPDFSVYYDMPFAMQVWNIFRARTIGSWLQQNGIKVIPNIRFGDDRSFDICCDGISRHSTIAIGSLGCIKDKEYRSVFNAGVRHVAEKLKPETIVFYGAAPECSSELKRNGINIMVIKPVSFHSQKEVKG